MSYEKEARDAFGYEDDEPAEGPGVRIARKADAELATLRAQLAEVAAERDALRPNAERYLWLRDKHPADLGIWVAHGVVGVNLECWRNEVLDAAIDDARKQP